MESLAAVLAYVVLVSAALVWLWRQLKRGKASSEAEFPGPPDGASHLASNRSAHESDPASTDDGATD
jgi:hypothetical protein